MRKIALEEHFEAPGMSQYEASIMAAMPAAVAQRLSCALVDFDDARIATMDECGIDVMVLSQTSPGVQIEKSAEVAERNARSANDFLAERIARHPARYRGFAHVAMQSATAAADELERCVKQLGFVGALINGQTNGVYLDHRSNDPFWERVAALDVPVYIHPANPYGSPHVYEGRPEIAGAVWGWNCETSAHFLQLVFAGLFDRFPTIKIILGHMGETIPFYLWRIDSRALTLLQQPPARKPSQVIREHLIVTTSGVCSDAALRCAIEEMGIDSVLFSTDYPYEDAPAAARWIDRAALTAQERERVCYKNAERVLRLSPKMTPT